MKQSTAGRIYDPVRGISESIGLDPFLAHLYQDLVLVGKSAVMEKSINDVTMQFHVSSLGEYKYYVVRSEEGTHPEIYLFEDLREELTDDDVFWDIGGGFGLHACFVGKTTGAEIVTIESHPGRADRIRENLELNDIAAEVHEVAMADRDGELPVMINYSDARARDHLGYGERTTTKTTEMVTGETLIENGTAPPTVIKIDVEGVELDVLRGLGDHLASARLVYVEIHPNRMDGKPEDIIGFMEECGFNVEEIGQRGGQYHVRCTPTDR